MVTVQIKENSQSAKDLIKVLKTVTVEEKSPYNPEFVKKIKAASKQKGKIVDPKNLWESLGLK